MQTGFDERKSTQLAAQFLSLAGRKMKYIRLIKLLYIADREALGKWLYPLTGDTYYSLRHGPVVSTIYDLVTQDPEFSEPTFWGNHIKTSGYDVLLRHDPSTDALAPAEITLVHNVHEEYKDIDTWNLVKKTHEEFPEWEDPGLSRIPITYEAILKAMGMDEDGARERASEIEDHNYFRSVLNCS
jgi:uncharacterized phage-associated protein